VELLTSCGESCSKLGGECDSTGVVALSGDEEVSVFSIRAGVLLAFLEGVQRPTKEDWRVRGLLENFWQVLEGDGYSRGISMGS